MQSIMLLGDIHGNTNFFESFVVPAAKSKGIRWIYQVGDFGYWEHTENGRQFLDDVNSLCVSNGLEIVFIQGNHDKVSLIPANYGNIDGFYRVRSSIWFAPNGLVWSLNSGKTNFIALGGAYSVDKQWRLGQEKRDAQKMLRMNAELGYSYIEYVTRETLWFPEEEMTDSEMDKILGNVTERIDIILSHDVPFGANVPISLLPIAECEPNQRRLQKAVKTLKPKLLIHGHLHVNYVDGMRIGDDGAFTEIHGLGADVSDNPSDAWTFLTLEG